MLSSPGRAETLAFVPPPTNEALLLQLLRLSRAQFDMRSAGALTWDLDAHDDDIGPRAYGLLAGIAVSYARPFNPGRRNPYGPLEAKWARFPLARFDFAEHHRRLLEVLNTLLAHNDLSPHRATLVWPRFVDGRPAIAEGRSPVQRAGIQITRELCAFQEERFGARAQQLAAMLQEALGWEAGEEINLDEELARLRGTSAPSA